MKGVYTLWSNPLKDNPKGSFNSLLDALVFWTTSVHMNKKYFSSLELVTDDYGYDLLINKLRLPFDNVRVELNNLDHINNRLWAYGKLISYKIQDEPFMHLDHDVFWTSPIPDKILDADIFSQGIEDGGYFEKVYTKQLLQMEGHKLPENWIDVKRAYNCGIFGGKNLDFIKEYVGGAIEIANIINDPLFHINDEYNIIYEQYYLSCVSEKTGVNIISLLSDEDKDKDEATLYGYTHFLAQKKRLIENVNMVHAICSRDYKSFYSKCIEMTT
jgi:hypothetical protein